MAQNLARDEAGNVWQVDAQGNPVRLVTPSQSASPFMDPRLPYQTQTAAGQAAAAPYEAPKAQAEAALAQAQAANAPELQAAKTQEAQAQARAAEAQAEIAKTGKMLDPSQRAAAIQGYQYGQMLDRTIADLSKAYNAGPGSTHGVYGLKDYLPLTQNQNFDTIGNQARGIVGQALGFTGGQLNTPREAEMSVGPYLPQSSDRDEVIQTKIQALQHLSDQAKNKAIQILGGIPDANGNITPVAPPQSQNHTAVTPNVNGATTFATGATHDVVDPARRAEAQVLGAMLAQGAPDDQIRQEAAKLGLNDPRSGLEDALAFRKTPAFNQWMRQNPGKAYPIDQSVFMRQVPMSGSEQFINKVAQSPAGAFGAAFGNAASGGYADNIAGALGANPEQLKIGSQLLRTEYPGTSLVGDVGGQLADDYILGRVKLLKPIFGGRFGQLARDAAYGAFRGSGENESDPLTGAIEGAGLNAAGGMFGRGLQKGLGASLKGVRNANLGYLDRAGIPLTIGRIARGAGDFNPNAPATVGDEFGKGVGGIEDRLAGFPGLDAVIGTARQRGDQAFNQAAFREIAPGVTGTGAEGLASAKAAENAAYGKLNGVRMAVDQPFNEALNAASVAGQSLSRHSADVADVINSVRSQISNGEMSGEGLQSALQSIRKARSSLSRDVMGHRAAQVLDQLDADVNALGARQGGTVSGDLAAANAIHGRRQIVKTALRGGPAQGAGEMFSPKALNQAAISNTNKFGGSDRALSDQRPFYDLTSAGMAVMPNLTPDSGTAGRLLLYPLIAGAGGSALGAATDEDTGEGAARGGGIGTGLGLLTLGAAAGPYSRVGQRFLQRALLAERPAAVATIGNFLMKHPKLAGMFGAGLGRHAFMTPGLPLQAEEPYQPYAYGGQ